MNRDKGTGEKYKCCQKGRNGPKEQERKISAIKSGEPGQRNGRERELRSKGVNGDKRTEGEDKYHQQG